MTSHLKRVNLNHTMHIYISGLTHIHTLHAYYMHKPTGNSKSKLTMKSYKNLGIVSKNFPAKQWKMKDELIIVPVEESEWEGEERSFGSDLRRRKQNSLGSPRSISRVPFVQDWRVNFKSSSIVSFRLTLGIDSAIFDASSISCSAFVPKKMG